MKRRRDEDDGRSTKRYRRTFVDVADKRFPWMHNGVSNALCDLFSMDDMVRLTDERDITDIRYEFLERDGLDDAPTPVTTPRRTRTTQVEFDFAAE